MKRQTGPETSGEFENVFTRKGLNSFKQFGHGTYVWIRRESHCLLTCKFPVVRSSVVDQTLQISGGQ
jgi:hypothetical protein